MSIAALFRETCARYPSNIALRSGSDAWTYAELDRLTDKLAAGLAASGIQRGDRVTYLLPNGPELVFVDLACLKLGAVVVPLNTRLKGNELAYIIQHCRARLCITDSQFFSILDAVRGELAGVEAFHVVGLPCPAGAQPFTQLLEGGGDFVPVPHASESPATILYTSGTTSKPKGATHTQRSLSTAITNYVRTVGITEQDVVFGMLSLAHVFGFTLQLLAPLSVGAAVVVAPHFDPESVLDLIGRQRVTHVYGLPVMFDALSRHPAAANADVRSLRYCFAGGDSVTPDLSERMKSVLGVELYEGCGMTEVIPYTLNHPGIENRVGSIGPVSLGMHLRLVDETGADVRPGEPGEIWVQSEALMAGYWDDPEATAQVMTNGWFKTGDVARCDGEGYYWFVGRSKEIIKRGGSKISPLEIEDVLSLHPAVHDVAVVGKPDPVLGERVIAFIVLNAGAAPDAADLQKFAGESMANYKVPEFYSFVPELPRGATGKVHRKTLKEWAAKGTTDSIEIPIPAG